MVDTHDSGSCAERCGGSSPPLSTKNDYGCLKQSFFVLSGRGENPLGLTKGAERLEMGNAKHSGEALSVAHQSTPEHQALRGASRNEVCHGVSTSSRPAQHTQATPGQANFRRSHGLSIDRMECDEDVVRRSDPALRESGDGIIRSVTQKDSKKSGYNPIPLSNKNVC